MNQSDCVPIVPLPYFPSPVTIVERTSSSWTSFDSKDRKADLHGRNASLPVETQKTGGDRMAPQRFAKIRGVFPMARPATPAESQSA